MTEKMSALPLFKIVGDMLVITHLTDGQKQQLRNTSVIILSSRCKASSREKGDSSKGT